jgi:hypothetical protein
VCFKQAANSLTQLYKQSAYSYNIAYQQGRQDALQEVFQWFIAQTTSESTNGVGLNGNGVASSGYSEFKNVSKQEFFTFMQEKINSQVVDAAKAHDDNNAFVASLMPPPPNRAPTATATNSVAQGSNHSQ